MKKLLIVLIVAIFSLQAKNIIQRRVLKEYMKAYIEWLRKQQSIDSKADPVAAFIASTDSSGQVLYWEWACMRYGVYDTIDEIAQYHNEKVALIPCPPATPNDVLDELSKNANQYLTNLDNQARAYPVDLQGDRLNQFKKILEEHSDVWDKMGIIVKEIDDDKSHKGLEEVASKLEAMQKLAHQFDLEKELDKAITECHGEEIIEFLMCKPCNQEEKEKFVKNALRARDCLRNFMENNRTTQR